MHNTIRCYLYDWYFIFLWELKPLKIQGTLKKQSKAVLTYKAVVIKQNQELLSLIFVKFIKIKIFSVIIEAKSTILLF